MKKYPHLEVRISKIHHRGVFAALDIKKGVRVIQYTGRILTLEQSDRSQSDYIFQLNSKTFIDGKNTARYINHSCEPNCEVEIAGGKIWIKSTRAIKKGEELLFSYSYDLEESKDYPCVCGTKKCVGSILDKYYWPVLAKLKKKKMMSLAVQSKTASVR
jgi:uncharacterized protein